MIQTPYTGIIDAMPFEEYQAVPGVHKSMLDEFARCPLAGYEYMTQRPDAPSKAMIMGSAVDCLLCEPSEFASRFWIRPETYESDGVEKPWNGNSKVCKEWLAAHRSKPVLTCSDVDEARATAKAVLAEPKALRILKDCTVQTSLFWVDSYTGLQLKGRPDFVGKSYGIDLKVVRDASERAVSRAIAEYRYHIQAAIYSDGLKANGRECDKFYFIFVEPGDNPKPNVRRLKREALDLGRMTYNEQLLRVRDCMKANYWPGFSGDGDEIQDIDVPAYSYTDTGGLLTLKIGGNEIPI